MGYSATVAEARLHLRADQFPAALAALKALCAEGQRHAWDPDAAVRQARDLDAALAAWGWDLAHSGDDPARDVISLDFTWEKLGDEEALWTALAPFVTPGSYIEMVGEDGERWRWVFKGPTVKYVPARYHFPEE